ncbi:PREDICTED: uncharacterized protein LOC108367303 isoform X1 [Rhagoletis zephyria]|uniref:uncharacterized protein LOC108367303 isoform X1 n=2 Tax=Rhagoletis zephyria TaxID=28612 RepID=UPI000811A013|nr:PREDICTED: uncharacterized protein LOC108367303 isoform X1 [Rhagoletis zephyria]
MRAHFAGDVATAEAPTDAGEDSIDKIEAEAEPLDARIDEFKQDSKNMEVVSEFIDDVLQKAEAEAVKQQDSKNDKTLQQPKEKTRQSFTIPDLKNGKMVNRARGLVVRIFDAICNCANTAAGPAQRIKLRAKRAASAATAPATENGTDGKKDANVKEKKSDKKQKDGDIAAAKATKEEINGEKGIESVNTPVEDGKKEADAVEKQETEADKH